VQIDLWRRLADTRCNESDDMHNHFGELLKLDKMLAGMGTSISDTDFTAIIMGSLPESYKPILSSMSASAHIAKMPLTLYELISFVSEEYEHRQLAINSTMKKVGNSAFTTDSRSRTGKESAKVQLQAKGPSPDAECYNCHRKGHYKSDCWSPGGRKGRNKTHAEAHRLRSRQQLLLLYPKSRRILCLHLQMCNQ
jgi:hypothetical protein